MIKNEKNMLQRISPLVKSAIIAVVVFCLVFALVATGLTPDQYDIQVGTPATVTIYATKDIEDTVTTQLLRNQAADAVEPSYKSVDATVQPHVTGEMQKYFTALQTLKQNLTANDAEDITAEELSALNINLGIELDSTQLSKLIHCEESILASLCNRTYILTRDVLNATLPEGKEGTAITSISKTLLSEGNDATLVSICMAVVRNCIEPNMLIDEEVTQANIKKARDSIAAEMVVKGEVIVREGEIVTQAQYTMISSLGLLADDKMDIALLSGVFILTLMLFLSLALYLVRFNKQRWAYSPKTVLLLGVISVLTLGICLVIRMLNVYLMPVCLGLLLVASLISARDALYVNLAFAMLVSLLASASSGRFTMSTFSVLIMNVTAAPAVTYVLHRKSQRTSALFAGLLISAINFTVTLSVGLINATDVTTVLIDSLWAAGGGLLACVMCIGLQPLLEWMFNLASAPKLLELSNPNHPLLRRMLLEASGTYHHSIIVANLAEAAADSIGANGLLARVGAYYHDVGKLKRPMYFKENQMGDNPHLRTDPRVSTAILTAHTRDGVQMAQRARIPAPIIDIIREHHGDTPVVYFYDKALKQYGEGIDIASFRYDGPRPHTKEAAIVMLADTVEAAVRAMSNPTPDAMQQLIHKLVHNKMTDGQLDESELTFVDLDRICSAFFTVLGGMFHERIEYPEVEIPPRTESTEVSEPRQDTEETEAAADGPADDAAISGAETAEAQPAEDTAAQEEANAD